MEATTGIAILGVAAVALIAWNILRSKRRHVDRRELKEQVQAWEDEGGNVPEVPTVSPDRGAPSRGGRGG
jgi:hypothetical protein